MVRWSGFLRPASNRIPTGTACVSHVYKKCEHVSSTTNHV